MGPIEEGGKVAVSVVEAMKSVPLAIALLAINVGFLAFFGYLLSEISANAKERNRSQMEMITNLVASCAVARP